MVGGWSGLIMDSRKNNIITDMDKNMDTGPSGIVTVSQRLKEAMQMEKRMEIGHIGIDQA